MITNNVGQASTQIRSAVVGGVQVSAVAQDPTIGNVNVGSGVIQFAGADLSITAVGLSDILAGETLIYAINIENTGFQSATDTDVFAGVPLGKATIDHVVTPDGVTLGQQGINSVSWVIPQVNVGDHYKLLVYAHSAANLTIGSSVRMDTALDATGDLTVDNNHASVTTHISVASAVTSPVQPTQLDVTYSSDTPVAGIGDTVTLRVTAHNNTTSTLYNVEGFAAFRDTFAYTYSPVSILTFQWPQAAHPGTLEPGETAVATFAYTLNSAYPTIDSARRNVWVKASDADPSDGFLVANGDALTPIELALIGPGGQVQVIADKTSAQVGEVVNFTVRVLNQTGYSDSLGNIVVHELLGGTTLTLNPTGAIAPGQTTTATFAYTVKDSDRPQINALFTVEGQGVTYPSIHFAQTASRTVTVNVPGPIGTPPPTFVDLAINLNAPPFLAFPNRQFDLSVGIRNDGNIAAHNVTVRTTLPLNIIFDNLAGGVSDPVTHSITWTLPLVNGQTTTAITPRLHTTAPIGTQIGLVFTVVADPAETNLANNQTTFSASVVQPAPSHLSLTPVDRNYVIVDGEDVIYLRLALIDQLGAPFPNATGAIGSTVSGVSFNPPSPVVLELEWHGDCRRERDQIGRGGHHRRLWQRGHSDSADPAPTECAASGSPEPEPRRRRQRHN